MLERQVREDLARAIAWKQPEDGCVVFIRHVGQDRRDVCRFERRQHVMELVPPLLVNQPFELGLQKVRESSAVLTTAWNMNGSCVDIVTPMATPPCGFQPWLIASLTASHCGFLEVGLK